jgi:hypothetical protein
MAFKFNPLTGTLDLVNSSSGEGGGSDTYSRVNSGEVDGTTEEVLDLFFNTLKIFYLGSWITLAQVSFDSLWDSQTDEWDSATMTWDSPLA